MRYSAWQCRLYGHTWRHPGEYEVVLSRANGPVYPVVCPHCGSERYQAPSGERVALEVDSAPGHEQGPELTE